MNFSMMDSKHKYMKVYILSAPNDLYQFSSSYNYNKVIDICITRNWIEVLGERNSEGADFVLLGVMSMLTLDAFALQTGSTS